MDLVASVTPVERVTPVDQVKLAALVMPVTLMPLETP